MQANRYAPAVYTPAHRDLSVIDALPAPERWIGQANWRADSEAKQAILLHPRPAQAEWDAVSSSIRDLET
eukprot:736485-Pyramimonas_sp.AAC.1